MLNWIKTHKFSIIYFVSFFLYPFPALLTLFSWEEYLVVAAVPIFLFQLVYIIWLRRKENISLSRSIARFFLYLFAVLNIWFVCYFVDTFINGYTRYTWGGHPSTYYGAEAWDKDILSRVFFFITLAVFAVYLVLYLAISTAIRRSQTKK